MSVIADLILSLDSWSGSDLDLLIVGAVTARALHLGVDPRRICEMLEESFEGIEDWEDLRSKLVCAALEERMAGEGA